MRPPNRILRTIAAVAASAVLVLAATVAFGPRQVAPHTLLIALVLAAGALLARRFPVQLSEKTKTSVCTVPLAAAVVLLPLPVAMVVTIAGIGGAELWRRTRWFQALFNTSAGVLQVAAGGALFLLLAGTTSLSVTRPGDWLLPALVAVAALYAAGLLLIELMVSVQLQRVTLRQFWRRIWISLPQEAMLSLLGLVVALVLAHAPWALPLVTAPAWLIYRSLRITQRGLSTEEAASAPAHLAQLPRRLQLAIVATGAAAIGSVIAVLCTTSTMWNAQTVISVALIAGLAAASYRLPIKTAPKRTLVIDASLMMVAIVGLAPGAAVIAVVAASVVGNMLLHRPWFNTIFNAAQRVLAAVAACAVYALLAPTPLTNGITPSGWLVATIAAIAYWLSNQLLVDVIVTVQLRRSPFAQWFVSHRQSLLAHVLLMPVGILMAPLLGKAIWLLPALVLPALAVRAITQSALQLDAQTDLLLDELVAAFSERFPSLPEQTKQRATLAGNMARAYGLAPAACNELSLTARLAVLNDTVLAPSQAPAPAIRTNHDEAAHIRLLRTLLAAPIVAEALAHRHLAYDGSSDAAGPRGAALPLPARMLAVCEAWSAAMPEPDSASASGGLAVLLAGAGRRWDPQLVGLLAQLAPQGSVVVSREAA